MPIYDAEQDGEYWSTPASRVDADFQDKRWAALETRVKLRALLGISQIVSDVSLFTSPFVVRLFADPGFRYFLSKNPTFLTLKIPVLNPLQADRSARQKAARAGWNRVDETWTPVLAPMDTPEALLALAEVVNDVAQINVGNPLWADFEFDSALQHVIANYPPYSDVLVAGLLATSWFSEQFPEQVVLVRDKKPDLYQMLKRDPQAQTLVELISKDLPNCEDRKYRARIWTSSPAVTANIRFRRRIILAWNQAVAENIEAEFLGMPLSAEDPLPSIETGDYWDVLIDRLPALDTIRPRKLPNWMPIELQFDPSLLSWETIASIVTDTVSERHGFVTRYAQWRATEKNLKRLDPMVSALEQLAKAVAKSAADRLMRKSLVQQSPKLATFVLGSFDAGIVLLLGQRIPAISAATTLVVSLLTLAYGGWDKAQRLRLDNLSTKVADEGIGIIGSAHARSGNH